MTGNSGTNFNRPQFKQMISDIEDGKIDIVITKDLSRLGREYLQTGSYIEIFFPANNVRYIAVNDGVDTAPETLAKQGKYTAPFAPYGYKKDPENKHHLLVDENTAPVVKRMFQMAMEKEKHLPRSPRFSLQKKY